VSKKLDTSCMTTGANEVKIGVGPSGDSLQNAENLRVAAQSEKSSHVYPWGNLLPYVQVAAKGWSCAICRAITNEIPFQVRFICLASPPSI